MKIIKIVIAVVIAFVAITVAFFSCRAKQAGDMVYVYQSVSVARDALRERPDDAAAHRTIAEDSFRNKRFDEAVREWSAVVKLQPENRSAKLSLAVALRGAGSKNQADALLRQLSQQNDAFGKTAQSILVKEKQEPK